MAAMIELRAVSKRFGPTRVLAGLNLQCAEGEVLAIKGESGCGKTTLLRIIAGLEQPDAGGVWLDCVDGSRVPPHRRGIAFAFQSPALWPNMTIEENVRYAMETPDEDRIRELLCDAEIARLARRYPAEISGGQAKRAALVRALAPRKPILLLDEPVTHLGERLKIEMIELIQREVADSGATLLYVTHSDDEATAIGGRLLTLPNLSEDGP